MLQGARLGYLPTQDSWAAGGKQAPLCEAAKAAGADKIDFKAAGVKAYNGIINNFIKVNDDKTISLTRFFTIS